MSSDVMRLEDVVGTNTSNLSTEVNTPIEIEVDIGNLLALDHNSLPVKIATYSESKRNDLLKSVARDCTQVIVNKLWQCPTKVDYDSVVALLPAPTFPIPREKPVPKSRPPTKWEEFAKKKGIQKKERNSKVWDPETKTWKFSWGYRKQTGEKQQKDYAANLKREMEQEENENRPTGKDQKNFNSKKYLTKGERVAKNELNRLRNISKWKKHSGAGDGGILPTPTMNNHYIPLKSESRKALDVATTSTASLGRFTETLKNDPRKGRGKQMLQIKEKNKQTTAELSKDRAKNERDAMLKVFENLQNKRDSVDKATAAKAFVNRKDAAKKDEEILGRKPLSKTAKKKKDGARSHANRVPIAQLKKGMKKKPFGKTGSGGKVTKKKNAVVGGKK
ncbi:ribosome biogenesis regulatory protein homolog [Symsagittifera roscoffensis]|uniref:ribosome biogenesis regulatory protein homolog n=1 Tax=Symsagittifera roscoffensis TaxID=84072 RepID=UPI00307B544F